MHVLFLNIIWLLCNNAQIMYLLSGKFQRLDTYWRNVSCGSGIMFPHSNHIFLNMLRRFNIIWVNCGTRIFVINLTSRRINFIHHLIMANKLICCMFCSGRMNLWYTYRLLHGRFHVLVVFTSNLVFVPFQHRCFLPYWRLAPGKCVLVGMRFRDHVPERAVLSYCVSLFGNILG